MVIHVVSEIRCEVCNGNEGHIFKNQILSWWYSYTQNSNIIKKMVVIISEIRNDDDDDDGYNFKYFHDEFHILRKLYITCIMMVAIFRNQTG